VDLIPDFFQKKRRRLSVFKVNREFMDKKSKEHNRLE